MSVGLQRTPLSTTFSKPASHLSLDACCCIPRTPLQFHCLCPPDLYLALLQRTMLPPWFMHQLVHRDSWKFVSVPFTFSGTATRAFSGVSGGGLACLLERDLCRGLQCVDSGWRSPGFRWHFTDSDWGATDSSCRPLNASRPPATLSPAFLTPSHQGLPHASAQCCAHLFGGTG
uniref:Uncharacterized protein n=1 Tax=Eutreptiella gymnastica TaxID=73025 RepID=A0A6T1W8N6_9EUGL